YLLAGPHACALQRAVTPEGRSIATVAFAALVHLFGEGDQRRGAVGRAKICEATTMDNHCRYRSPYRRCLQCGATISSFGPGESRSYNLNRCCGGWRHLLAHRSSRAPLSYTTAHRSIRS